MAILPKQNLKKLAVVLHDLLVTALAIWLVFVVRFEGVLLEEHLRYLPSFLPFFVAYAGLVYWFFSLYRSKWRFASDNGELHSAELRSSPAAVVVSSSVRVDGSNMCSRCKWPSVESTTARSTAF